MFQVLKWQSNFISPKKNLPDPSLGSNQVSPSINNVDSMDLTRLPNQVTSDSFTNNLALNHDYKNKKVKHEYHDHSTDSEATCRGVISNSRGGASNPFPSKLYDMLNEIEKENKTHIVSWQPHGRCFVVHDQKLFIQEVMPKYFQQKKYASFQRQLNLYGFSRLTKGCDKGGYYHELFLRGKRFLIPSIPRKKVKGTGARMASNPEAEPQFYSMAPAIDSHLDSTKLTIRKQNEYSEPDNLQEVKLCTDMKREPQEVDDDVLIFEGKPFHYLETQKDNIVLQHLDTCPSAVVKLTGAVSTIDLTSV